MKKNIDMLQGPLGSNILRYAVPIMLTSLLQLLFNAADLVVVGQFCGSISVGAVSATGSITGLIINLFIGFSVGAGVAVAHGLGGKQDEEVHRTVHTALLTAIVSGVFLTVVGVVLTPNLLELMKTPENVLPLSTVYMRVYFCGMVFTMVYNFSASILRAVGDTKTPLIYLSTAGVINVVLNVFFVTVFHMNVAGVALATAISQGFAAAMVVRTLTRRTDACRLLLKELRFYKKQLIKIISIGLPAGIQASMFSISNVIIQSSINSFNSDAIVSGSGAAANIEGFVYVIMDCFNLAAVNFVGQNAGAHQFPRIKKIYGICIGYVMLFGIISGAAVCLLGEQLLSIYINDSAEAINYGVIRFKYVVAPYFICGCMNVSTGSLRGLGSSFVPMVISILGVCGIRLVWIYTIFQNPLYHTLDSLYFSYPISWILTFILQTAAFIVVYKLKSRKDSLTPHPAT